MDLHFEKCLDGMPAELPFSDPTTETEPTYVMPDGIILQKKADKVDAFVFHAVFKDKAGVHLSGGTVKIALWHRGPDGSWTCEGPDAWHANGDSRASNQVTPTFVQLLEMSPPEGAVRLTVLGAARVIETVPENLSLVEAHL